jgi:hypothetical protein
MFPFLPKSHPHMHVVQPALTDKALGTELRGGGITVTPNIEKIQYSARSGS